MAHKHKWRRLGSDMRTAPTGVWVACLADGFRHAVTRTAEVRIDYCQACGTVRETDLGNDRRRYLRPGKEG